MYAHIHSDIIGHHLVLHHYCTCFLEFLYILREKDIYDFKLERLILHQILKVARIQIGPINPHRKLIMDFNVKIGYLVGLAVIGMPASNEIETLK